jgi:hypothetical protein
MEMTTMYRRRIVGVLLALATAAGMSLAGGGAAQAHATPAFNNASGYSHLVSIASGKCLDVLTESALPGFAVDQLTCRNAASQEWSQTQVATVTDHRTGGCGCTYPVWAIRNHNGGNCLTIPAGDVGDGTPVVQDTCVDGNQRQWWRLEGYGGYPQVFGMPPYRVTVWHWYYRLRSEGITSMCIDVNNGSTADELPMQMWDCVDIINQQWDLS